MDLSEFLLARIAEDWETARASAEKNGPTWSTAELSGGTRVNGSVDGGNPRSYSGDYELWDDEGALGMFEETATHVVRWHPARVLAECEARRRIVEEARAAAEEHKRAAWAAPVVATLGRALRQGEDQAWWQALCLLALPYADHPDYREEWRP